MRFHELQMQQESLDSDFNYFTLEGDDAEEVTDEDTLDSVDHTQESMTAAYCEFMLESSRLMAAVYETDAVCCEAYEAATTVTEREEITALYENKVVDFLKKIGAKLKNALLAIWNWVKQFTIKYYNKIKGWFKNVLTNKAGLKDSKYNDVEIDEIIVLKGDLKSIMTGSDLYKVYEKLVKLDDEWAKVKNDKDGYADYTKKLNEIIGAMTIQTGRNKLEAALIEKKTKVTYSNVRDAVLKVAGKPDELLKVLGTTVETVIKRQITRVEQRVKALERDGHNQETSMSIKILQNQNNYLNAISTEATTCVTKAINSTAAIAKRITDTYKKDQEAEKEAKKKEKEAKKAAKESLVLDLESRLYNI